MSNVKKIECHMNQSWILTSHLPLIYNNQNVITSTYQNNESELQINETH